MEFKNANDAREWWKWNMGSVGSDNSPRFDFGMAIPLTLVALAYLMVFVLDLYVMLSICGCFVAV